jgi:hypothetical protein
MYSDASGVKTEKAKYVVVSRHHNVGQNDTSLNTNKLFGNVAKFKNFETTVKIKISFTGK